MQYTKFVIASTLVHVIATLLNMKFKMNLLVLFLIVKLSIFINLKKP